MSRFQLSLFFILLILTSCAHNLRGLSQIKERERSAGVLMHITLTLQLWYRNIRS